MKKIILIAAAMFASVAMSAQDLKFGHINMQEVIFLMDEMDSARVTLEKYNKDIQETYNSMMEEYYVKMNTYQQMSANWTPSVLEAKQKEIQDIEARLQQYQQSAQMDLQNKQQELMGPVTLKAQEAVRKIGKQNGMIYVFDISSGTIPYFNESLSKDVTAQVKAELKISPDKKLPAPAPAK